MSKGIVGGTFSVALFAALVTGCGAPTQAGQDNYYPDAETDSWSGSSDSPPKRSKKPGGSGPAEDTSGPLAGLDDDQKDQIEVALRRGSEKAAQCNAVTGASVTGEGEVMVVFDGKIGRATDATMGSPFAGTPVEPCIKRAFVGEIVLPFEGTRSVPKTVKLAAGAPPATGTKPKK